MTSRYIIAVAAAVEDVAEYPVQYFVIDRARDVVVMRTDSSDFAKRVQRSLNDA